MPHPSAPEAFPLESEDYIPTDASQEAFVKQYLEGLTLVNNSMKGKVYIHCLCNFSFFKRDENFRKWMTGSQKSFKIDLQRCDLEGTSRFSAGLFFHVVPRPDYEELYCEIVEAALADSAGTRTIPKFVIQTLRIFMRGEATKVYNMVTTTKRNADILSAMMRTLAPTPSADTTFIPHNVWNSLTQENKNQYLLGQSQYLLRTSAARFVGIQDSRLSIAVTGPLGRNGVATSVRTSILSWVSNVKTLGGQRLFRKVFPSVNGDMLLMYNTSYMQEVRAWMSSALSEIASQSGLHPHVDREAAEAMFKSPIKVWKNMESRRQRGSVNFPSERAVYVQYVHPEVNSKQLSEDKKKQKKNSTRPTRLSLIFALDDVDIDDANSVLTGGSVKSTKSTKSAESASSVKRTSVKKTALKQNSTTPIAATSPAKQSPTKGSPTKATALSDAEVTAYNIEKAQARVASERAAVVARSAMSAHPTEDPTKIFSSMYAIQYDKFDFPYHSVYVKAELKVLTPATLAEAMAVRANDELKKGPTDMVYTQALPPATESRKTSRKRRGEDKAKGEVPMVSEIIDVDASPEKPVDQASDMAEVEESFEEMDVNCECEDSVASSGATVMTAATVQSYAEVASRKIQWTAPSVKVFEIASKPATQQVYKFEIKGRTSQEEAAYKKKLEAFMKRNNLQPQSAEELERIRIANLQAIENTARAYNIPVEEVTDLHRATAPGYPPVKPGPVPMPPRKPHVPSPSHAAWSTVEPSHAKSQSRENRSTLAPRPPPQMNYMFPPQTTAEPASETPKEAEKRHRKQISALRVDHANALYAIEGKQMSEAAKALTEEAAHRTEMNAFKAESERTCALLQEQIQQLQASLMMMHAGDRPAVAGTTSKRTTSVALTTPPRNKHSSEALLNKVLRNTSSALAIAEVSKSGKLTKISTSPATKATRNRYTALQDDEEEEEDVSVLTYYDDFANENESVTAMSVKSSADASEESETYNVGELSLVSDRSRGVTVGLALPDPDQIVAEVSKLASTSKLRQQKLFEFCALTTGSRRGLEKRKQDFELTCVRDSVPWGDEFAPGDQVQDGSTFRVLSHNVNGLSQADNHADVRNFVRTMKDKGVAVFGIQETNRNFEKHIMVHSFHSLVSGACSHHRGAVSSARLNFPSNYQPGGTAVSVLNEWATRFLDKGSDDMGRWSWVSLAGQGTTKVTMISAYRVCDGGSETSLTTKTVRAQQEWMYADRGIPSVNLREQIVVDLKTLILRFTNQGHDIILMMDANEGSGTGSAIDRIITTCGLVDAHTLVANKESTPPPTYQRGSKKIDFILITPRVASAVKAVGILPLHDGYLSDHRALMVDLDPSILFASATSPVIVQQSRRLTSTNPVALRKYSQSLLKYVAENLIEEKVAALEARSRSGEWCTADIVQWELVDCLLERGRRQAESDCKGKRSGKVPWSPQVDRAGKRLLYWQMRLRAFTSGNTNRARIKELAESLGLSALAQRPQHFAEIANECRRARRALKKLKTDATALREQHLEETAKLAASLHNMSATAAQSAILARERSSRLFKTLRRTFGGGNASGFDRLDVPDVCAVLRKGEQVPRIPVVVKEEIEQILVPHTVNRFRQHKETPFGNGDRSTHLGIDCTSEDVQKLLKGGYDRSLLHLTVEAREWLLQLKETDYVQAGCVINTSISCEEWVTGWAKMRESTASAPGSHYGHFKAASVAARLPEDHPDHSLVLADIYSTLTSMPLQHGFAPMRWRQCVDAIIEKIPGKPMLEKLRIIMLFAADFNYALKLVWGKRLVQHAEHYKVLGTENHGSRPGRQTTDALMEKLLIYEHARLTRTSVVTMDNDAKSCYDRIIKTLAMTACMSVGLPLMAAKMHNLTHHGMVHEIKSRHGLFSPYQGTDQDPLEGTGQGSGGSPAIWLIYVVSLLNAFRKFTTGIRILSPYSARMALLITAVFFVDDGMPGVNDAMEAKATRLDTLLAQAESAAQSWERLLFVSGGALELTKCFVYILYWDLSQGKHRVVHPSEIPGCTPEDDQFRGPVSLTYGNDATTRHKIVTKSPYIGTRTLGVRIAPAGGWKEEFDERRAQARLLGIQVAGSGISHEAARVAYRAIVCPKLEYPLAVTQFTQKQCDSISSPVLRACLSQMGYNSNMPREVVYGPMEIGGIGMHDLYIEQGIKQITTLVGHVRQDSETGRMMVNQLQWCQVQAGTSISLLESPRVPIDYIEDCWIMCIRDFLATYNFRIEIIDEARSTLQCVNDEFIMDALRKRGCCTALDLQSLNACRMFLRVEKLSEICTMDGKSVSANIIKGFPTLEYTSTTAWPRQGTPTKAMWLLWKKRLMRVFSRDGKTRHLRVPLGAWITGNLRAEEWNFLAATAPTQCTIYRRRADDRFDVLHQKSARGSRISVYAAPTSIVATIPVHVVPAELGKEIGGAHKVEMRQLSGTMDITPDKVIITSFLDYVLSQQEHISSMLLHCDTTEQATEAIRDALSSGTDLDCGTDGGLLNDAGTYGFIWASRTAELKLARGRGHVSGAPSSASSTRSELCGMFAALTYLRLITEYYHIVIPRKGIGCTIYCDSQAALRRVEDLEYDGFGTTWRCRENYDLEAAIRTCLFLQPAIKPDWKWVRGHAILRKKRYEFTWAEILNEEADECATEARQYAIPHDTGLCWPEQAISVIGTGGRITGRLYSEIRELCTLPDLLSYWQARYRWSNTVAASVDFPGAKAAIKRLKGAQAARIQKLRCGWLPVNYRESWIDPDRRAGCSACSPADVVIETVDHIYQCQSQLRRVVVKSRFATFRTDFLQWNTTDKLIEALLAGSQSWMLGHDPPSVESLHIPDNALGNMIKQAYEEQSAIGWNVLFRGFWSAKWRTAQDIAFCLLPGRRKQDTGLRWSAKAHQWFFDLFEIVWGARNEVEHGFDESTQRVIRLAICERAIRRLYQKSTDLPTSEQHPFRSTLEDLLTSHLEDQEFWVTKTTEFIQKALRRQRDRPKNQSQMTDFFSVQQQL